MLLLIIVLRVIHIFCGVFWVGFGMFNVIFLQPTVKALGADGQKIMQYLTQKTRFQMTVYTAATLTVLSGIALYWILTGFNHAFISSGYGVVLTSAGVSGIIGWFIAVIFISRIFNKMKVIGGQIQASGNPPSPEQAAQLQSLVVRLGSLGKVAMIFILVALLGMSFARFVPF